MKAALPLLAYAAPLMLGLAACAPAAKAPPPQARPVARPAAPAPRPARPTPLPAPVSTEWMDAALTPGGWRYEVNSGRPVALFLTQGVRGDFVLSCERNSGLIGLWRRTSADVPAMTIRTETATRSVSAAQGMDTEPYLVAKLASSDPLLDAMALSKGRFAVEVEGQPTLILPSYAEVSRVIEDCR
jgi:hypothetical protein